MNDIRYPKVFCPAPGDLYFYIRADLEGMFDTRYFDNNNAEDRNNFFLGNCFETIEEVKEAIERLQVRALLRYYSSKDPGWTSSSHIPSDCFRLVWRENIGTSNKRGFYKEFSSDVYSEGVYFPSHDSAMRVLDQVGEDRVKHYLGVKI